MKHFILAIALMMGSMTPLWAAVQTDTHTYIVGREENAVLAINRQTGQETLIPVGEFPQSMVIHATQGYVVNLSSNKISVIDLLTNTLTGRVPVGEFPQSMVIHGDEGYVMNWGSDDVSVIDLLTHTVTGTIPVGRWPRSMVIHGNQGYVVNRNSGTISVIDLLSHTVTQTIPVGEGPRSMVIQGNQGYVVNELSNNISVIDLLTKVVIQTIPVGRKPQSMVIHGDQGHVVNSSNTVSVIDLKTHTVTGTIAVGRSPQPMVIHGDQGYVVVENRNSDNVSVIDLLTNTVIQTIPVGRKPQSMVIHGDQGYVRYNNSNDVTVIDLTTNKVIAKFKNPGNSKVDFSDTHVYLGLTKARPHYPTLVSYQKMKTYGLLGEFKTMMPDVFNLGEIEQRALKKENLFETLPPYVLAHNIFWDIDTDKPLMDPKDILATLVTMKYPQKLLQSKNLGNWLLNRLHTAFFQTVWMGDDAKAKTMLTYFVQLQDPVITKLATYTFKKTPQGATNSTALD